MKLRDVAARVRVDIGKLTDYVLNLEHETGGHKAVTFSWLGYTSDHAAHLREQILALAPESEAVPYARDENGVRYRVHFKLIGPNGKTGTVRSGWIVEPDSDVARLTTAWVVEVEDE